MARGQSQRTAYDTATLQFVKQVDVNADMTSQLLALPPLAGQAAR